MNILRQQNRVMSRSSRTSAGFSEPFFVLDLAEYSSHFCETTFPHVKQRIGIIMIYITCMIFGSVPLHRGHPTFWIRVVVHRLLEVSCQVPYIWLEVLNFRCSRLYP